ncbi:MAG: hypothetical protein ACKPEA_02430, partial [Planctomycetota bacterium]
MSKASAQPRTSARKATASADPIPAPKSKSRSTGRGRTSAKVAPPAPETMPLDTPEAIDAAWRCYVGLPAETVSRQALRNRLIERYLDVVRFTAERLHKRLPSEVDV